MNIKQVERLHLTRFLFGKMSKEQLLDLCQKKGLPKTGRKTTLIERLVELCSIDEVLLLTKDIRSNLTMVDAGLLDVRLTLGSELFLELFPNEPVKLLEWYEKLLIFILLDGPKTKREIFENPLLKTVLEHIHTDLPAWYDTGEAIMRWARKTLVQNKIVLLEPRTWQYSINPEYYDYFRSLLHLTSEEIINEFKSKHGGQFGPFRTDQHKPFYVTRVSTFQKSPSHVLSPLIGKLGEELGGRYLIVQGFKVCRFPNLYSSPNIEIELSLCPHIRCKKTLENIKDICEYSSKDFCLPFEQNGTSLIHDSKISFCPCTHVFPKICNSCNDKGLCPVYESFNIIKETETSIPKIWHIPDFIAHRQGINYLVEVKTNRLDRKVPQEKFMEHMKNFGYKSIVVHVNIPLESVSIHYEG